MTDDDRELLGALDRLSDASGSFALSIMENSLSQEDQIEMALAFLDMADRVLKRIVEHPKIIETDSTSGGRGHTKDSTGRVGWAHGH